MSYILGTVIVSPGESDLLSLVELGSDIYFVRVVTHVCLCV